MELLKFVRLIVILVAMVSGELLTPNQKKELSAKTLRLLEKEPQQGPVMCARLSKEPYFELEKLLGRPWRIYYGWNMDLQNQCLDMTFRNATTLIINRFYNDMSEFLMTEPLWDTAMMLVRLGRSRQEMLLFPDQGPPGRFQGVPNVVSDGTMVPTGRSVPLLRFHFKLLYGGKYLLMADCQIGVTTLSARRHKLPYRAEIGGIVSNLDIGLGHHTCQTNRQ